MRHSLFGGIPASPPLAPGEQLARSARLVAARAVQNDAVLDALLAIPDVEQRWDEPGMRDRIQSLLPKGPSS